jgi:hypothetical protein
MFSLVLSIVGCVMGCIGMVLSFVNLRSWSSSIKNVSRQIVDIIKSGDCENFIRDKIDTLLGGAPSLSELNKRIEDFIMDQAKSNEVKRYGQMKEWLSDRNELNDNIDIGYKISTPRTEIDANDITEGSVNEAFPEGIPVLNSVEELDHANNEQVPINDYVVTNVKLEESHARCDKYGKKA